MEERIRRTSQATFHKLERQEDIRHIQGKAGRLFVCKVPIGA